MAIVNVGGGGKGGQGGTVVIIVGTLFFGYLYFTGRLQAVVQAVQTGRNLSGMEGSTSIPGNLPPIGATPNPLPSIATPPISSPGYPRNFILTFPSQYNAKPVMISAADSSTCYGLVYAATIQATGSLGLAAMNAAQYC